MTVCELPKASSSGDVAITRSSIPCELEFAPRVAAYLDVAGRQYVLGLTGSESSAHLSCQLLRAARPEVQLPDKIGEPAKSHSREGEGSVTRGTASTAHAAVRQVLQEALGGLGLAGSRLAGDYDALALCVEQAAVCCRANPIDVRPRRRVCTCHGGSGWQAGPLCHHGRQNRTREDGSQA